MIVAKNIYKSFDGKQILCGVTGIFEQGKTSLIIGASGTGKSVLLKCIVGLIKPDHGYAEYHGRDFTNARRDERTEIRREIGMLFQGSALFDSKTVEENIRFPLDMFTKQSMEEKVERVNAVLKRVGMENVNDRMPSEISGGMQKRVGIARAIVMNPRYLFCDEPNSGLDPQTSIKIDNLIQELTHEYNTTTIIVTHDMNSVMEIGEYILFMSKGYKIWEGSNDEIMSAKEQELDDFIFANKLMRQVKKQHQDD